MLVTDVLMKKRQVWDFDDGPHFIGHFKHYVLNIKKIKFKSQNYHQF